MNNQIFQNVIPAEAGIQMLLVFFLYFLLLNLLDPGFRHMSRAA